MSRPDGWRREGRCQPTYEVRVDDEGVVFVNPVRRLLRADDD